MSGAKLPNSEDMDRDALLLTAGEAEQYLQTAEIYLAQGGPRHMMVPAQVVKELCTIAIDALRTAPADRGPVTPASEGREFKLVGFCYGGQITDDCREPVELAPGTNLYTACWTEQDIAEAKTRAHKLFGSIKWEPPT